MECILRCQKCGNEYSLGEIYNCPSCGGIVNVRYEKEYLKNGYSNITVAAWDFNMWSYRGLLPPLKKDSIISLDEGGTPLIKSRFHEGLYFKDETRNPTGSFKDRPISVCVSMAKELGVEEIIVASSGNGAAAASAYASRGGLRCRVFVPESTPSAKVAQAAAYGGEIVRVPGNFSNSYAMAMEQATKGGAVNVTTTFLNPYGVEGDKTIAFEIFWQLNHGRSNESDGDYNVKYRLPHNIIIPVGAGPILYGIYKGFWELMELGVINNIPRLIAAQAIGCAPIVNAFLKNERVVAETNPVTIAGAICDPLIGYEQDGDITLEAIYASNGAGIALEDKDILAHGRLLAAREGIFAEPAAAASYACYNELLRDGKISSEEITVCIVTGSGLKDSSVYLGATLHKTL